MTTSALTLAAAANIGNDKLNGNVPSQRRRFTRVKARSVAAHLPNFEKRPYCQLENISAGGMFVRTDELMPIGLPVTIDLVRPGLKKALRLDGVVVSVTLPDPSNPRVVPGIAVRFDAVAQGDVERLNQMLKDLGAAPAIENVSTPAPAPAPSINWDRRHHDDRRHTTHAELNQLRDEVVRLRQAVAANDPPVVRGFMIYPATR